MSPISIVQRLPARGEATGGRLFAPLREIIAERRFSALFQPVNHMGRG